MSRYHLTGLLTSHGLDRPFFGEEMKGCLPLSAQISRSQMEWGTRDAIEL